MSLQKFAQLAVCLLAACILLYFFPLVRVGRLGQNMTPATGSHVISDSRQGVEDHSRPLDVDTFIELLWTERLPAAIVDAPTVDEVFALAATDTAGARKEFGREVGLGGPTFVFLRGRGRIESVYADECRLMIANHPQRVVLEIGILVSNAVRDATGLVNVNDFPNSQDFNRLSAELNKRCESEVIRPIRDQLVVGSIVEFAGCGEVRDNDGFTPLKLIPVQLRTIEAMESTE